MRITKKWGLLLAAPLASVGAMVPTTAAHATPGAGICAVVGSVHLSNGVHVNPTISSGGTYNFNSTVLACAGTVTGIASVASTGSYNDGLPLPSFSGSLQTSAFTVGGSCSGTVGGTLGTRIGPVVIGTLAVTCGNVAGGTTSGIGATVLTFVPNPTTLNTCGGSTTDPVVCDSFMAGPAVLAGT
jgi:hypothetical protein